MNKKSIYSIVVFFLLAIAVVFTACKKDEDDDLDPNVFCNESKCATNAALKEQCIDAFNTCMATEPDANDDECAATALLICN